jgi:hypothetical protein
MRIQAKRLQQNDVLKIPHVVKSSKAEQLDLLIKDAKASRLLPVYCFYASERQRKKWKVSVAHSGTSAFEFGCLIASAHRVRKKMPKSLSDIENDCVPWHYLIDRRRFRRVKRIEIFGRPGVASFMSPEGFLQFPIPETVSDEGSGYLEFPTIDDLNRPDVKMPDREGLIEGPGTHFGLEQSAESFRERRISKLIEIDVREFPLDAERLDRRSYDT